MSQQTGLLRGEVTKLETRSFDPRNLETRSSDPRGQQAGQACWAGGHAHMGSQKPTRRRVEEGDEGDRGRIVLKES